MVSRADLKDQVWLRVAREVARLSTCARRRAGCVLLSVEGEVLSTGYNGMAAGETHCTESRCSGAHLPSGTGLEACQALHAEWNAIAQCKDIHRVKTVYLTASPCVLCVRMLANTSATRIVFLEEYPHPESGARWLRKPGRTWEQVDLLSLNMTIEGY